MSILQILDQIGSDTKKSHKISIVNQNKNNDLFMKVINLALNPYINFYIKKIPEYQSNEKQNLEWALNELEKLSTRQITGNAAIEHLRNILSNLSNDDSTVISRIIGKDLRCGMAEGIVNAVVKDFIPGYPCLLARPFDEKSIENIVYPAYSQLKADGVRANAHVDNNNVFLCGRSGREIDLLGTLDSSLIKLANYFPWPVVFDGEFVVVDDRNQVIDRKTGNGIINKAIKGTISEKEAKLVRFQLWDAIPMHEFKLGISSENYEVRLNRLVDAMASFKNDNQSYMPFWIIDYKIVNNLDEAVEHFNFLLSQKHEGTILKNKAGLWEDTRSKHLVKMKAEKDCDLEIIGWNPGTGQFEGQVGSLICASSDRKVIVSISGFSFELRRWITENINNLIGTIVAITYNERIKSKEKGREQTDSLFLPRFLEFRNDKSVANSDNEIK